jgi:hypothetical protein
MLLLGRVKVSKVSYLVADFGERRRQCGERESVCSTCLLLKIENRVSAMYIEKLQRTDGVLYLGLGSCQLTNRRTVVSGARVIKEWSRNLHRARSRYEL